MATPFFQTKQWSRPQFFHTSHIHSISTSHQHCLQNIPRIWSLHPTSIPFTLVQATILSLDQSKALLRSPTCTHASLSCMLYAVRDPFESQHHPRLKTHRWLPISLRMTVMVFPRPCINCSHPHYFGFMSSDFTCSVFSHHSSFLFLQYT